MTDAADYNSFDSPVMDGLQTFEVMSLQIAKIVFDFRDLPEGFEYNEHFAIILLDSKGKTMELPEYFAIEVSNMRIRTFRITRIPIREHCWRSEYLIGERQT